MKTKLMTPIISVLFGAALVSTNIMAKPEYNKDYQNGKYNAETTYTKKGKPKHGKITDSEGNVLSKEEAAELKADVEAYLADNPDSNPKEYLKEQGYTFNKESGAEKKGFGDRAKPSKEELAEQYGVDASGFDFSTKEGKGAFKEALEAAGAELPEKKDRFGGDKDKVKRKKDIIFEPENDVLADTVDQDISADKDILDFD